MATLIIATYSFILLLILSSALSIMFSWREFNLTRDESSEMKNRQLTSDGISRCRSHSKSERKLFSLLHAFFHRRLQKNQTGKVTAGL